MAKHDFDDDFNDIDDDLSPSDALDAEEDNDGFADLPSPLDLDKQLNEDEEDKLSTVNEEEFPQETEEEPEKMEFTKPPSDNAAAKMVETFNDIYTVSIELSHMANETTKEVKKLIALGSKKNDDVVKVIKDYETVHKKLYATIQETQNYFNLNRDMAKDLDELKKQLEEDFERLNDEINAAQNNYKETINKSTIKIEKTVSSITENIKIDDVIKKVNTEIGKAVKESSLNKVEQTLSKFEDIYFQMEDISNRLKGSNLDSPDNKKIGLIEELTDVVDTLDQKLYRVKKFFNFFGYAGSFVLGAIIFSFFTYIYMHNSYQVNLSTLVVEQTEQIHDVYKERINKAESSSRAYYDFSKRYGLDNKRYGFDYFEDNNEPYFYFPKDAATFSNGEKIFIKIK